MKSTFSASVGRGMLAELGAVENDQGLCIISGVVAHMTECDSLSALDLPTGIGDLHIGLRSGLGTLEGVVRKHEHAIGHFRVGVQGSAIDASRVVRILERLNLFRSFGGFRDLEVLRRVDVLSHVALWATVRRVRGGLLGKEGVFVLRAVMHKQGGGNLVRFLLRRATFLALSLALARRRTFWITSPVPFLVTNSAGRHRLQELHGSPPLVTSLLGKTHLPFGRESDRVGCTCSRARWSGRSR